MELEHYELNLNGDKLSSCLQQLNALEEGPRGTVEIKVVDGTLMIERRINNRNRAAVELEASGHWPFPLLFKWSIFDRLLLKEHASMVKFQLSIDPASGKGKFVANGMHFPLDEVSKQLSFELSTQIPSRAPLTEKHFSENSLLERIRELDAINSANGTTSKELIAKSYERDQNLNRLIKQARGESCQICGHYFLTPDGGRYVECHHLEHLANEGLDCSKNILVVCANHHRQLHYGVVKILSHTNTKVVIEIDGVTCTCTV